MSDRSDDLEDQDGEGFSARWLRRKTAERVRAKDVQLEVPLDPAEKELKTSALTNTAAKPETEPDPETETETEIAPEDLPDIETLDKDSDYTPFLQSGVPDALRRLALRKLWLSDPAFGFLDGLNDYDENYSAIGIIAQEITTSYVPGRGYVDPEEPEEEPREDIEENSGGAEISQSDTVDETDAADEIIEDAEIADTAGDDVVEDDDRAASSDLDQNVDNTGDEATDIEAQPAAEKLT